MVITSYDDVINKNYQENFSSHKSGRENRMIRLEATHFKTDDVAKLPKQRSGRLFEAIQGFAQSTNLPRLHMRNKPWGLLHVDFLL